MPLIFFQDLKTSLHFLEKNPQTPNLNKKKKLKPKPNQTEPQNRNKSIQRS